MARFDSANRDLSTGAGEDTAHDEFMRGDDAANSSGVSPEDGAGERQPGALARFGSMGLLVIAVASLGAAYYFYGQAKTLKENPQKIAQSEVAAVITQVGSLIVLPEGESPTVATVSDAERLRGQPFFANAKNGDRVLIYTTARKAILYNPEQNKIVEVAPLNIGQ